MIREAHPIILMNPITPIPRGVVEEQQGGIVVLDPDVAEEFPNSNAVNSTLRTLLRIQKKSA